MGGCLSFGGHTETAVREVSANGATPGAASSAAATNSNGHAEAPSASSLAQHPRPRPRPRPPRAVSSFLFRGPPPEPMLHTGEAAAARRLMAAAGQSSVDTDSWCSTRTVEETRGRAAAFAVASRQYRASRVALPAPATGADAYGGSLLR